MPNRSSTIVGICEVNAMLIKYLEGDVYSFPFKEIGGFGAGMVLRTQPHGRRETTTVLLAGFGKRFDTPPTLNDIGNLTVCDIAKCTLYWHQRLRDGGWTPLGPLPKYSRARWPLPLWKSSMTTNIIEFETGFLDEAPALLLSEEAQRRGFTQFLTYIGCGQSDGLRAHLQIVIRNPNHIQHDVITPERLAQWDALREQLRAEGRYPPPLPKPDRPAKSLSKRRPAAKPAAKPATRPTAKKTRKKNPD